VRRKPFSVVLFDEVEKAHADVFNTLLQILEDGRLTDAQGRSVDFKNTVLIMTSNLGTADLRKSSVGFAKTSEAVTYERMKTKVNEALKAHFRPEFLNRIDEVVVFHELSKVEVVEIVDLMIQRVSNQLELQGLSLVLTPPAKQLLADKGYDPQLGARPLRRAIQQMVEDPLSERILWKEFRVGETIVVDVETITPEAAEAYDVKGAPPLVAGEQQLTFTAIEGIEPPPPVELAGADSLGRLTPRPNRPRPVSALSRAVLALLLVAGAVLTAVAAAGQTPAGAAVAGPVTYSSTITIGAPPPSNFAGSGGGDGWAVALSSSQVFNVFHHAPQLQVACHEQSNAAPCWSSPKIITDAQGHNFSTSIGPGLYLDQSTGKLYVFVVRTSDSTAGVACIDTTKPAGDTGAQLFCGFTPLSAIGGADANAPAVSVSAPVQVGTDWYSYNELVGSSTDKLLCFEPGDGHGVRVPALCREQRRGATGRLHLLLPDRRRGNGHLHPGRLQRWCQAGVLRHRDEGVLLGLVASQRLRRPGFGLSVSELPGHGGGDLRSHQ
jgi:hypothetical protein